MADRQEEAYGAANYEKRQAYERQIKAQLPLIASRHDTPRHDKHDVSCESRRDVTCHVVHVAPCLFQHGGRRRSSNARV